MSVCVILGNYTEQGIKDIKGSPERVRRVRKAIEDAGGKFISFYYTMGQYDFVCIVEGDEAALGALFLVGSRGNVRTQSMKGFTLEEAEPIIKSLDGGFYFA